MKGYRYGNEYSKGEMPDPYSMAIVQELLQSTSEWINIQDIVKLTFKALFEVVRAQGETIRSIESLLPAKASKAELNAGLGQKANISDVSQTISEVASSIDSKVGFEEFRSHLDEKVSLRDCQYMLSNKIGADDLKLALDKKISLEEFRYEMNNIAKKLDEADRATNIKLNQYIKIIYIIL